MPRTRRFSPALGAAVLITAGLQAGCSSLPSIPWINDDDNGTASQSNGKQIEIRSNPAGAEVLANGSRIGITPMTVTPADTWKTGLVTAKDYGINYQYTGTLTIRMPGCKEYTANVDDYFLSKDIAVQLECSADYQPMTSTPAQPQPGYVPTGGHADYQTSEEIMARRLRRLEGLRNRSLITEDEYQQVRRRILGEL
jgi:hypothetical protein